MNLLTEPTHRRTYALATTVVLPPAGIDPHAALSDSFTVMPDIHAAGVAPEPLHTKPWPSPELLGPPLGAVFQGLDQPIVLQWKPSKELAPDEYYEIDVDYNYKEGNPKSSFTTRETQFTLPTTLYQEPNCGVFNWQVTLKRQTGVAEDGQPQGEAISYESSYWYVRWIYPPGTAPFKLLCSQSTILMEILMLEEAFTALNQSGKKARLIAGGTDVMVMIKQKTIAPDVLISLQGIPGLNRIEYDGSLRLGPLVTHRAIEKSQVIRKEFSALADSVDSLGSIQIRNVATLGGNIGTAAPSADTVTPLLVLAAQLKVKSLKSERTIPADQFFTGPGETVLKEGEILTEIMIPKPLPNTGSAYWKHQRRQALSRVWYNLPRTYV